jgi:pimeloyl-ACP methyl ester carboxylesterase
MAAIADRAETAGAIRRSLRARDGLRLGALDWPAKDPGEAAPAPILCLPGLARTALDYVALAQRQRGARRVVALDYMGHGDSERPSAIARYGVAWAIRDLTDAMAALHLHRVVLVGTSFGGILGMVLGVLRPACLRGVVLNDIGPTMAPAGLEEVQGLIGRDPGFATEAEAVAFLRTAMPPMALDEAGWRGMARRTYAPGADGRLHPRWDTRIVQLIGGESQGVMNLWPAFGALAHVPLLLVHGEASALLSAATVRAMQAARPDMALVALPGVGHAPTLDEPDAAAALDRFLAARR